MNPSRGKRRRRIRGVMQEWLRNPYLLIFPAIILVLAALSDSTLNDFPVTSFVLLLLARGTMVMTFVTMLLPFLP
jgi:hypothetical protein